MWYVVQTMSGDENRCLTFCQAHFDSSIYNRIFIPKYIMKVRYRKQWHDAEKVLFPGYIFIDTDEIEKVQKALREVPMFTRALSNADKVAPITVQEQEFLQNMMNEKDIVDISEGFIIGDRVCVTQGALRNYTGSITKVDRHKRIAHLNIDLFGRPTPIQVGFAAVARLTEEEFEEIRRSNIEAHEADDSANSDNSDAPKVNRSVRITSGTFNGMTGPLVAADEKKDEYTVLLSLFGDEPSRVVFHKEEIAAC